METPVPQPNEPLSQIEWIEFCSESDIADIDFDRDYCPSPSVIADHLESFMLNARAQTRHLDDTRLRSTLWAIFGLSSAYFDALLYEGSEADQIRVYSAFAHFYTAEVPALCSTEDTTSASSAIYMIWDMDSAEMPLHHPTRWPHLMPIIESCFRAVLGSTANEVSTTSILHGLFDARHQNPVVESLCRRLAQSAGVSSTTHDILIGIADGLDYHP